MHLDHLGRALLCLYHHLLFSGAVLFSGGHRHHLSCLDVHSQCRRPGKRRSKSWRGMASPVGLLAVLYHSNSLCNHIRHMLHSAGRHFDCAQWKVQYLIWQVGTIAKYNKLKYNSNFRVRFWGILGTGLFSPICGWLVDRTDGQSEFESDYSPTFHFFNFFVFLTVVISIVLDIEVSAPPKNMLRNLLKLIKSPSVWILFVVIFVLGTLWGFIESFLFWYLLDLKAPKMLLGLTLTTGAVVSLPFLVTSGWFVKRCGNENLMILALVFYFIRCYGYSLIESPFWCFPFEAMEVFTYHLMWVAAAIYSAELAPEGLRATMIGAVGSLHYGSKCHFYFSNVCPNINFAHFFSVGRASGSMIGGSMMALIGARLAFRYLGIGAAVTAVFYSIYYYGYFRKTKPASTSVTEVVEKTAAKKSTQQNGASVDCKVTLTNGTPDTVKVEAAQVMQIYSVEENAKALSNIKLETIERWNFWILFICFCNCTFYFWMISISIALKVS